MVSSAEAEGTGAKKLVEKHFRKISPNAPNEDTQSPGRAGAHPIPVRSRKRGRGGAPSWMTTYLDVTTLLLTFLVLMLASADFREKAFGMIGVSSRESSPVEDVGSSSVSTLTKYLSLYDLKGYVRVVQIDGKDAFQFLDGVRFEQGSGELTQKSREELYLTTLFAIERLSAAQFRFIIQGMARRSSERPIALASSRALAVTQFLRELNVPVEQIEIRTKVVNTKINPTTRIYAVDGK